MTQKRRDKHSTEFGLWLREQPEIDSSLGFVATNIDYVWRNYKRNLWMLIEEKRYGYKPKPWQLYTFRILDKVAKLDPSYRGFHLLIFEKTNPDDGDMWLDEQLITKEQLIAFLRFE